MMTKIILTMIAAGSIAANADTLAYTFDFLPTTISGPATFSYLSDLPTAPGTSISDVETSLGLIFPLISSRDSTGAWSFFWTGSPSFTADFTAETDLAFPNAPGFYSMPSEVSTDVMFTTETAHGTIDISIQSVPEPRSVWLLGLALASLVRHRVKT